MKKKIFIFPLLLTLFLLSVSFVSAQNTNNSSQGGIDNSAQGGIDNPSQGGMNRKINVTIENPLDCGQDCTLVDFLKKIVDELVLPIGAILAVLAFIYTGFLFVMAQGNPGKLTTARTALLYTVVGTALLLGAWVFANVIRGTVNSLIVN